MNIQTLINKLQNYDKDKEVGACLLVSNKGEYSASQLTDFEVVDMEYCPFDDKLVLLIRGIE